MNDKEHQAAQAIDNERARFEQDDSDRAARRFAAWQRKKLDIVGGKE